MRGVPTTLTEAQALFLTWLLGGGSDHEGGPRSVIDAHPELEGALQALWTRYRRIQALESGSVDEGNEGTVVELLKTLPGSDTTAGGEGAGETAPPAAPIHLGNYTFAGEIIEGDPVRIAVVRDENLGRELVMKVHRERVGESTGESLRRFLREAALLGELDHPGVPPIHEVGIDRSGRAFYTTPLREGESLRRGLEALRANRSGWMVARGVRVLVAVNETLRFAHSRGIVHGALTADDVFVGEFGEVLIRGWGSALAEREPDVEALELRVHASLSLDELFGVDSTISPEATADGATASSSRPALSDPDPAIDLRAVGELIDDLLRAAHPGGRGRPAELVAIADAARGADPWHTYQGVEPLAEDLRAFLERRVVRAHRTGALAELRQWSRRNRGVVAVVLTAMVSIAAGLAWYVGGEVHKGQQILELSDAQAIAILRRAADELWADPEERTGEAWLAKAQVWRGASGTLIERIGEDRGSHGLRESERLAVDLDHIVARRASMWHGGEHARWRVTKSYQTWLDELSRIAPAYRARSASPSDLARYEYLVRELEPVAGKGLGAQYGVVLSPWERFDPEGDPEEWRLLRQERLFRDAEQLTAEIPGFDPKRTSGPARGEIADVEWELERLRRWSEATDEAKREVWRQAYASVLPAEEAAALSPRYPLLPLGLDDASGLWQFWDFRIGARPELDAAGGALPLEGSAMVYVLVPGRSASGESPELRPFFVSRYELTQRQWQNFDLTRSYRWAGSDEGEEYAVTRRHPAEQKSPERMVWLVNRLAASIPTEAQWEHAAGAGRGWTTDRGNFEGDGDGFAIHAPVGSFGPNPFGLFDVCGNVSEVCWIGEKGYRRLEEGVKPPLVRRGGAWEDPLDGSMTSLRRDTKLQASCTGLRPVMELPW